MSRQEEQKVTGAARAVAGALRPVSFSGAGLSAESGISTFRDANSGGLWQRYDPGQLATPEAFDENPRLVTDWYTERRRSVAAAKPNAAHLALAARRGLVHVTQNVDDLLERAGATGVIHLHGTLGDNRCHAGCGHVEAVELAKPPPLARCPSCRRALMRPAVVWFGENLPASAWSAAADACRETDLLLVIGTSAAVRPAADLIELSKSAGATIVLVNTQPTRASALADFEIIGRAGELVPRLLDPN